MIETVLAFLAGWFLSWPALAILCGLGILFEHNEARGTAIFILLVSAVTAFFFFDVTAIQLATIAGIYLVVGTVWSFWRYRRYVRREVEIIKHGDYTPDVTSIKLGYLTPANNTERIVGWIIVWPFSAIDNLVGDFINLLTELVNTAFRKVYASIYEAATKGLVDPNK